MIAVISVLLVLTISIMVTRVASVALVHTGMGREVARHLARKGMAIAGFDVDAHAIDSLRREIEDLATHDIL